MAKYEFKAIYIGRVQQKEFNKRAQRKTERRRYSKYLH